MSEMPEAGSPGRSGTARRQTYGIVAHGVSPALVMLIGNYALNHIGPNINMAAAPSLFIKRGNYESGSPAANFDVDLGGARTITGAGTPEGVVTAPVGSLYRRTDGAAATTLYVKESGTGNTGWVAK